MDMADDLGAEFRANGDVVHPNTGVVFRGNGDVVHPNTGVVFRANGDVVHQRTGAVFSKDEDTDDLGLAMARMDPQAGRLDPRNYGPFNKHKVDRNNWGGGVSRVGEFRKDTNGRIQQSETTKGNNLLAGWKYTKSEGNKKFTAEAGKDGRTTHTYSQGGKVVKKVTFPKGFTARSTHTWDEDSLGNTYMSNGHRMNSAGYLANPSRSAQIRARDAGALTNREAASMGLTNKRDMDDEVGVGALIGHWLNKRDMDDEVGIRPPVRPWYGRL